MIRSDICIAGAGIIGLSLALELHARGLSVVVIDSGLPMQQASTAAAGMLAANDPHNPAALSDLSRFSLSLYPSFLHRLYSLSGILVPFQTQRTLQALAGNSATVLAPSLQAELALESSGRILDPMCGFAFLSENSIDPRQLAHALIAAVDATPIRTVYNATVRSSSYAAGTVIIKTSATKVQAVHFIDCTGAWAGSSEKETPFHVIPVKGQMLALTLPPDPPLKTTLRTEDIYIVPRTLGPAAGRAIVGATVEDAGFNKTVEPQAIESLRQRALSLLPALAHASIVESWAGLRPAAPDRLPIIGPHPTRPHHWLATGHYRNGILLAPGTARAVADTLLGQPAAGCLQPFSPSRPSLYAAFSVK